MPGIRIVTDSSCDLPAELVEKHGIEVVPLSIRFGDDEYVDLRDLSPTDFWEKSSRSPGLPETAAPSPGAFRDAFNNAGAQGAEGVVCVTISSALSATFQAASTAATGGEVSVPVTVVDSQLVTLALGFVVLAAAESAASGADLDAVLATTKSCAQRIRAYATLDTLENLRKGGRIGGAQAILGSVLSIKPVVHLVNGKVEPESRPRTRSKALAHLIEKALEEGKPELLGIAHGDAEDVTGFEQSVREAFPGIEIVTSRMGAVLGTHVGKGCMTLVSRITG